MTIKRLWATCWPTPLATDDGSSAAGFAAAQALLVKAIAIVTMLLASRSAAIPANETPVSFTASQGRLEIAIGGERFAAYVYADPAISRPYFAHVRAPGGIQATRNQPQIAGEDLMDHPTFHPGIWMAFGDLGGADDWRMTAPVKHIAFVEVPRESAGAGSFVVRNRYLAANDSSEAVCDEVFRCEVRVASAGNLIVWDSTFTSDNEFYFGDQEEMGLGIRVATPLRAQHQTEGAVAAGNGEILDAKGRRNEKEVWGESADWCDYSGEIDGSHVGMTIFCHPDNFRPSWFHARNTGLNVANPFGRDAFGKGEPSKVIVKPGESLRLRFGVLVHSCPKDDRPDLDAAYREYVELTSEK